MHAIHTVLFTCIVALTAWAVLLISDTSGRVSVDRAVFMDM